MYIVGIENEIESSGQIHVYIHVCTVHVTCKSACACAQHMANLTCCNQTASVIMPLQRWLGFIGQRNENTSSTTTDMHACMHTYIHAHAVYMADGVGVRCGMEDWLPPDKGCGRGLTFSWTCMVQLHMYRCM